MAAIKPPAERMLLVSKLDETIILDNNRYDLSTNDYGNTLYPTGIQYLNSFKKDIFPEWIYEAAGIRLRKTITMVYGQNTTLIRYEVLKADKIFSLQLLPLIRIYLYRFREPAISRRINGSIILITCRKNIGGWTLKRTCSITGRSVCN